MALAYERALIWGTFQNKRRWLLTEGTSGIETERDKDETYS
jgi:hypothetical protein